MIFNLLCTLLFILGVYHLVRYRLNLKKAAELSNRSLFPRNKAEFKSILIPAGWKEGDGPIRKNSRSYQIVKWETQKVILIDWQKDKGTNKMILQGLYISNNQPIACQTIGFAVRLFMKDFRKKRKCETKHLHTVNNIL